MILLAEVGDWQVHIVDIRNITIRRKSNPREKGFYGTVVNAFIGLRDKLIYDNADASDINTVEGLIRLIEKTKDDIISLAEDLDIKLDDEKRKKLLGTQ